MRLNLKGSFWAECRNPDGSLAWRRLISNAAVVAALNDILSVYFNSGTQKTSWFIGLVNNSGYTAFNTADTMSSHSGWSEWTAYNETTRQAWNSLTVSGGAISGAVANFSINAAGTLAGFFVASDSAKSGTSGQLWATGALLPTQQVSAGQQVQITYIVQAAATQ